MCTCVFDQGMRLEHEDLSNTLGDELSKACPSKMNNF